MKKHHKHTQKKLRPMTFNEVIESMTSKFISWFRSTSVKNATAFLHNFSKFEVVFGTDPTTIISECSMIINVFTLDIINCPTFIAIHFFNSFFSSASSCHLTRIKSRHRQRLRLPHYRIISQSRPWRRQSFRSHIMNSWRCCIRDAASTRVWEQKDRSCNNSYCNWSSQEPNVNNEPLLSSTSKRKMLQRILEILEYGIFWEYTFLFLQLLSRIILKKFQNFWFTEKYAFAERIEEVGRLVRNFGIYEICLAFLQRKRVSGGNNCNRSYLFEIKNTVS